LTDEKRTARKVLIAITSALIAAAGVQAIFESFGYRKVLVEFDWTSNEKSAE